MKKRIKLVIAEVYPILRLAFEQILADKTEIELLGMAQNVDEAVQLCQLRQPDVLLLQWNPSCVETLHLLQTECPTTKVLILISYSDAAESFSGISEISSILAAGASGAVSIDDPIAMILAAMHAIAEGQRWISPDLIPSLMDSHKPAVKPKVPPLTTREQEVLELMVTGKTDKQIARSLNISQRTVRDRFGRIYDKLNAPSRLEAAVEAVLRALVKRKS